MYNPAKEIQDYLVFGEFGGVNPSITDSSTFTFMNSEKMSALFDHEIEGCFLYSRHWNPINKYLSGALAKLEGSESAQVTSSGISAICCAILQVCSKGDEIISSRTIYGGTYALFKNVLPRFGIKVKFCDIGDIDGVNRKISKNSKIIYCESISNPLLDVSKIQALSYLSQNNDLKLIVDNTFSPMMLSPLKLGADVVIHSMTKFINGASDCVAGCICGTDEFIHELTDINSGVCMLIGPVLDSFRSASILKNMHTLHIRIQKHSQNAQYLAEELEKLGYRIMYPGLSTHPQHNLLKSMMNQGFGYGGMVAIDLGEKKKAEVFMEKLQNEKVGYLAVSLGYYKTLFSQPGNSTSSEIPLDEQKKMGLSEGIVRFSMGLDNNVKETFNRIKKCL